VADVSPFNQTHTYSSSSNNVTTFYTLPSGGLLAEPYENLSIISVDSALYPSQKYTSLAFHDASTPALLNDFYTFYISNLMGAPTLLESSLQLCVQAFDTTVNKGMIETREVSRSTNVMETGAHNISVPGDGTSYSMRDHCFNDLRTFLQTMFAGKYTIYSNGTINYGSDAVEVFVDTLMMALFLNGFATSITNAYVSNLPITIYQCN
jgi:hypothetical protein